VRYLAVDPGGRRLGLALGDDLTGIATPLEVRAYGGVDAAADLVAERAAALGAGCVVVGLPTLANGSETSACQRSHTLARAIAARGLAVVLQPEFLSTDEARRRAREAGFPRDRPIDHFAAQVLLEEYLTTLPRVPTATATAAQDY
jgi:putative holliday junction resolvase